MDFEAYKHHIYFFLVLVVTGLILQTLIHKLIISLNPDSRRNLGKIQTGSHDFFLKIGKVFSWTAALYLGCRMYYDDVFPHELFSFLGVVLKIESVVLIMFFLSHGINHILLNIATDKKNDPDSNIPSPGIAKKTAKPPDKKPLSWIIAFIIGTLGLNVIYFSSLINLLIFAVLLLFTIIFLYRSSEGGHQLVTGFIGYFYLKSEQKNCESGESFRLVLEDGKTYEVNKISLFHTSFKAESNTIIRNNSLLMIINYGFKEYNAQPGPISHLFTQEKSGKSQNQNSEEEFIIHNNK